MRRLPSLPAVFAATILFATAAQAAPTWDPRALKSAIAGRPTQILVLGSAHLSELKGFAPAALTPLLDRLAAYKPEVITIEGLSGQDCAALDLYRSVYAKTFDDYCWRTDEARRATGLDLAAALNAVDKTLGAWPVAPTAAQRRQLASLFLASGDRVSAQVQWLRLPVAERRAGDGLDDALVTILRRTPGKYNESYDIAAVLAVRLGLERVYPADDHSSDAIVATAPGAFDEAVGRIWAKAPGRRSAAITSGTWCRSARARICSRSTASSMRRRRKRARLRRAPQLPVRLTTPIQSVMDQYALAPTLSGAPRSLRDGIIKLHDEAGFAGMRTAGLVAAQVLDALVPHVVPGVTTGALDDLARAHMLREGALPATLGYRGYTHSCCISINHVVCHGIPGERGLRDGDIANIDVTAIVDGWHGDTSRMFVIGDASVKARRLVEVTYEAMMRGIEAARPGNTIGDIGFAIQSFAQKHRYGVVRDFCGHGVGRLFHDAPEVVHAGKPGTGPELKPGMFFTIEPMINVGRPDVKVLDDGWTAVTRDKTLSAQFEHSVGITDEGCEIFTRSLAGLDCPPY